MLTNFDKTRSEMTVETDKYILLADDDMEDQEILKEAILSVHPEMNIQCVWNGQEALNYLAGCPSGDLPSLIVLDYKMPVLNAVDVLNQIGDHPLYRSIPKVVWSTSRQPEHIRLCMERGADRYFSKPVSQAELDQLVQQLFEIRGGTTRH